MEGCLRHLRFLRVRDQRPCATLRALWLPDPGAWHGVGRPLLLLRPLRPRFRHRGNEGPEARRLKVLAAGVGRRNAGAGAPWLFGRFTGAAALAGTATTIATAHL